MISRIDRLICAGFVVFLALLLMAIVLFGATKNSDISNWIIALANVAMAGAAYAAYRKASHYMTEFYAKEGYTLAIKMVNENLVELNTDNKLLTQAHNFCAFYTSFNGIPPNASRLLVMNARLIVFDKVRTRHKQILNDCERLSIQMLSYGITAVDSRKKSLETMLISLQNCLSCAEELELFIRTDFASYRDQVENGRNLSQPFNLTHISGALEQITEMSKKWNQMVKSYEEFFSGPRHIQSLFSVKEGTW